MTMCGSLVVFNVVLILLNDELINSIQRKWRLLMEEIVYMP